MHDTLELTTQSMRIRQLDALMAVRPDAFEDYYRRMSRATTTGLAIVHDLAADRPELHSLMSQIMSLAETDRRLTFLQAIPGGPILASMRATTLERAMFGTETEPTARIALLIGIFTLLLDGVIDEAPEIFATIQPWLQRTMTLEQRPEDPPGDLHPIATAICWAAASAIGELAHGPGWRDPVARTEFIRATKSAYQTELESTTCRMSDLALDVAQCRERIVAKSTACIWAGALIPMVVHGWPAGTDPAAFETLAKTVGAFSGWIDDIVDLDLDLRADLWSMPLLEIYDLVIDIDPAAARRADRANVVYDGLLHPWIGPRLPGLGVMRWQAVCDAIRAMGIDEDLVVPVMADVARASLLDGLVPA